MERYIHFSRQNTLRVYVANFESAFAGDIDKIERVQRRATRTPTGFEKLEYEDRLKRLRLITLQERRIDRDV